MRAAALALVLLVLGGCAGTVMRPVHVTKSDYALHFSAPQSVSTGESAPITLAIEGRGGFHVNLEYPMRIELSGGPGTVLAKSALTGADALELNEERARFETEARWTAAGRQQLTARAQFAVCTPDTCVPREETLAIVVDVTGR